MDLLCNAMDTQELREKKNPMDHFTYGLIMQCHGLSSQNATNVHAIKKNEQQHLNLNDHGASQRYMLLRMQ